jgi:glycosyltransferase involved in cell wall biosynthesis
MRVTVSVGGRFHAFYLARELQRHGALRRLITSYPRFEVAKYGISKALVRSLVFKEVLARGWQKLPRMLRQAYNPQFLLHEGFDVLASRHLEPSDVVVAWSSFGLHTLRRAKAMGAVGVLERGSPHMLREQALTREVYEEQGLRFNRTHPRIIEKELQEYQEAHFICVPSQFAKRSFLQEGVPEEKLLCVPYGVDLGEFYPLPKQDSIFRVVYAGSMALEKGVQYLLRAFSELRLARAELLLVGGLTEEIRPVFRRYEGLFRWVGHVPQRELNRYYAQGSVFVMMGVAEGLAMVQPQAMAAGLPVICSRNSGGEDIVRDGIDGFVIPSRDTEALKEKLLLLYRDPELCRHMGRQARERVKEGFSWRDYGQRALQCYRRLLDARG